MKVAIIEPHYDDCWLNVGGFMLRNRQHDYRVITVSKDDNWGNNVNNTRKLAKYIPNFQSVEFRYDSLDVNSERVKQQMQKSGASSLDELFSKMNQLSTEDEVIAKARESVQGYDAVFLPLGMNHPMHVLMRSWSFDQPILRYQEYPYAYYAEEAENIGELTKGMKRFEYDISKVLAEKENIFREVYSSEIFVLSLPECTRKLSDLDKESFYTRDSKGEEIWQELA